MEFSHFSICREKPSPDLMRVVPRGCSPHTPYTPQASTEQHLLLQVLATSSTYLPHARQSAGSGSQFIYLCALHLNNSR